MALLERCSVPEHIVRHSIQVARAGLWLARRLEGASFFLDRRLVEASCLLHDISKMYSIENGGEHALLACEFLERAGYGQVGQTVRQHVWLDAPVDEIPGINEAMVVNYADKRVRHHEVVSLEERFDDLFERYADTREKKRRMRLMYEETRRMEKRIFSAIGAAPDALPLFEQDVVAFDKL